MLRLSLCTFLAFCFIAAFVLATPPCTTSFPLPADEIELLNTYYEDVHIVKDNCWGTSYNFTTPLSYSKINISYVVYSGYIGYADNITELDSRVRNAITKIENCSGFENHVKGMGWDTVPIPKYNFSDFGTNIDCLNMQNSIDWLKKRSDAQETNNLFLAIIAIASIILFAVFYTARKHLKRKVQN